MVINPKTKKTAPKGFCLDECFTMHFYIYPKHMFNPSVQKYFSIYGNNGIEAMKAEIKFKP